MHSIYQCWWDEAAAEKEIKDEGKESKSTLPDLEKKTQEYIEKLGIKTAGVYFYKQGASFKINWQKDKLRGPAIK